MKIKMYQADAFTDKMFGGNPAAVCVLDKWLDDSIMQNIAMENNLSETAFLVKKENVYELRWFTPVIEVDLCGHATLASSHILFSYYEKNSTELVFHSKRSGTLKARKNDDRITLNFPVDTYKKIEPHIKLYESIGIDANECYLGKTDYMLVYNSEEEIKNINPDFGKMCKIDARGVIVTAKGNTADFVSRFFGPQSGVNEDPVTGSAHTTLTPFWADRLGKNKLTAMQLSNRKGYLECELKGNRVEISGQAVTYFKGEINILTNTI
jgi:PhzF family phenazine biosynthesis protein